MRCDASRAGFRVTLEEEEHKDAAGDALKARLLKWRQTKAFTGDAPRNPFGIAGLPSGGHVYMIEYGALSLLRPEPHRHCAASCDRRASPRRASAGVAKYKPADIELFSSEVDVLVINYGLHYHDPPAYAADMAALFAQLDAWTRAHPGKVALFRETSAQHFGKAGSYSGCETRRGRSAPPRCRSRR